MLGKKITPLDNKLNSVKWGEYKIEDLFKSNNGDFDIQKKHINGNGEWVITSGLKNNGIMGKSDVDAIVFDKNTITIDMFGNSFYRQFPYKMVTHARVFSLIPKFEMTPKQGLFIANSFSYIRTQFGYANMCSWEKIKNKNISLPQKANGDINFEFMDSFIHEIKQTYLGKIYSFLNNSGITDCRITHTDINVLDKFKGIRWKKFNIKELFKESTRGSRLKSSNRIVGNLPFVTAGESNTGISDYIGNSVTVFKSNTITIDMFGSAKYRNYEYGADDHIAVVHTESLPKFAAVFVTTSCHKAAHTGEYNYGKNFYAKDADALNIMLPSDSMGAPDYAIMSDLIQTMHKIVLANIVNYVE